MATSQLIQRLMLLVMITSACALPALAQQTGDDVIRVNTELVQTDFTVFDKQGNFVDGLKREQFLFKIDGKPREISFFDRIAAGSRSEEAQIAAARGTTMPGATAPLPLDRGRTVFFFIDDLHLSPGSISYTRETSGLAGASAGNWLLATASCNEALMRPCNSVSCSSWAIRVRSAIRSSMRMTIRCEIRSIRIR